MPRVLNFLNIAFATRQSRLYPITFDMKSTDKKGSVAKKYVFGILQKNITKFPIDLIVFQLAVNQTLEDVYFTTIDHTF